MSNPFDILPIILESSDQNNSFSSFEYSDSDEFRDTIISFDFKNEFSSENLKSIKGKIGEYRDSIDSYRKSIRGKLENIEDLSIKLRNLEERVSLKDLELDRISGSIHYYSTEIEESSEFSRDCKSAYKESKEKLSLIRNQMKNKVLEAETNFLIKSQELFALKEYLKSVKNLQEIGKTEQKLKIQLANNRNKFVLGLKAKLTPKIESHSLYLFIDSGLSKVCNWGFQEIIEKFLKKNKQTLKTEFKIWTFSRIFHFMKMKILEDFQLNSSKIREKLKKNLGHYKKPSSDLTNNSETTNDPSFSHLPNKSSLLLTINHLLQQLSSIEKRVKHKQRQHKRSQKQLIRKTAELTNTELKLATLKSNLFTLDLSI